MFNPFKRLFKRVTPKAPLTALEENALLLWKHLDADQTLGPVCFEAFEVSKSGSYLVIEGRDLSDIKSAEIANDLRDSEYQRIGTGIYRYGKHPQVCSICVDGLWSKNREYLLRGIEFRYFNNEDVSRQVTPKLVKLALDEVVRRYNVKLALKDQYLKDVGQLVLKLTDDLHVQE